MDLQYLFIIMSTENVFLIVWGILDRISGFTKSFSFILL